MKKVSAEWFGQLKEGNLISTSNIEREEFVLDFSMFPIQNCLDELSSIYNQFPNPEHMHNFGSGILSDTFLVFIANFTGPRVRHLLQYDRKNHQFPNVLDKLCYIGKNRPKLSSMKKHLAKCTQVSALNQFLLQSILPKTYQPYYIRGTLVQQRICGHAFNVITNLKNEDWYIVDCTGSVEILPEIQNKYHGAQNLEMILKPNIPILQAKKSLDPIPSKVIYTGEEIEYGFFYMK